jgi:hypothetical protein
MQMQINDQNFEAYLLDLMEGRLTADQEDELIAFLEDRPELYAEQTSGMVMPAETAEFLFKDDLKKGGLGAKITRDNFEQFCIARLEGDLSTGGIENLQAFLEDNPDCRKEALVYDRLVLKPDTGPAYPHKSTLKKNYTLLTVNSGLSIRHMIYISGSIAATLALIISLYLFLPGNAHFAGSDAGHDIPEPRISSRDIKGNEEPVLAESLRSIPEIIIPKAIDITPSDISDNIYEVSVERETLLPVVKTGARITPVWSPEPAVHPDVRIFREYRDPGSNNSQDRITVARLAGLVSKLSLENDPEEDNGRRSLLRRRGSESERLSLWDLARAGIKGINSVAGTDMHFEHEYDADGNLVQLTFSSRILEIQRTAIRSDEP